jgi:1-deoxy-D-xylulose-5-phosphate synthase
MDGIEILLRSAGLPPEILIVPAGVITRPALRAAVLLKDRGFGVTVVGPRGILPARPVLLSLAASHRLTVAVEDGRTDGGTGTALARAFAAAGVTTPVRTLCLPNGVIDQRDREELLAVAGLIGLELAINASSDWP